VIGGWNCVRGCRFAMFSYSLRVSWPNEELQPTGAAIAPNPGLTPLPDISSHMMQPERRHTEFLVNISHR